MQDEDKDEKPSGSEDAREQELQPGEVRLTPAGKGKVRHEERPPSPPADKKIHSRRPLPPVPEKLVEQPPEENDTTKPTQ